MIYGGAMLAAGLNDLEDLFQRWWFCDSVIAKEEISRLEEEDKKQRQHRLGQFPRLQQTQYLIVLFLQQCLGMGLALGIILVGIDKRLKGLNEKRI